MQNLTTIYLILTPGMDNIYMKDSQTGIKNTLRKHFWEWQGFFDKYKNFSLSFYIVMKLGTTKLNIKGPSISKKIEVVDYSIFLPDEIKDLNHYIDLVFEGIGIVLAKFNVPSEDVEKMKNECKKELNLS